MHVNCCTKEERRKLCYNKRIGRMKEEGETEGMYKGEDEEDNNVLSTVCVLKPIL